VRVQWSLRFGLRGILGLTLICLMTAPAAERVEDRQSILIDLEVANPRARCKAEPLCGEKKIAGAEPHDLPSTVPYRILTNVWVELTKAIKLGTAVRKRACAVGA